MLSGVLRGRRKGDPNTSVVGKINVPEGLGAKNEMIRAMCLGSNTSVGLAN
jgi:hypothetical protein